MNPAHNIANTHTPAEQNLLFTGDRDVARVVTLLAKAVRLSDMNAAGDVTGKGRAVVEAVEVAPAAQRIIDALTLHGPASPMWLSAQLEFSRSKILRLLNRLIFAGLIHAQGNTRSRVYTIATATAASKAA